MICCCFFLSFFLCLQVMCNLAAFWHNEVLNLQLWQGCTNEWIFVPLMFIICKINNSFSPLVITGMTWQNWFSLWDILFSVDITRKQHKLLRKMMLSFFVLEFWKRFCCRKQPIQPSVAAHNSNRPTHQALHLCTRISLSWQALEPQQGSSNIWFAEELVQTAHFSWLIIF